MRKSLWAAAAVISLVASPAIAEIRLDLNEPVSGFAGKGDIKDLFGFTGNNSPNLIHWQYGSSATFTAPCLQQQTGNEHSNKRATIQAAGVGGINDARKNKGNENNTGYILSGNSSTSEEIIVECPGGFNPDLNSGNWTQVGGSEGEGLQFSTNGSTWVSAPNAIVTSPE